MYEQREKPKEKVKANNRPDTRSVVTNRVRHFHDHDDIRGDFLGRPTNGLFNGLLQRQPKGRVRPIVPDDFESQSSTIQRAAMAVTAAEMLALASRLVAALAAGGTLSKSLQALNKSPEFERMTSVQKMTVYSVLYKVANKAKPNKTETLPAEFDAHSTTGGSEITEQGVTNTSQPLTDQAILDLLGPIPASEDKTLVGNTHLPIADDLGLGLVYSEGRDDVTIATGQAETLVGSDSKDTVGNTRTILGKNVVSNKPLLGTLSELEARKWYHTQEDLIPSKINASQPAREQALEAFVLRNKVRTDARELMRNRELAAKLDITDPNLTLKQIVRRKYQVKGLVGEDLWADILQSSTQSRPSVDKSLGLTRRK